MSDPKHKLLHKTNGREMTAEEGGVRFGKRFSNESFCGSDSEPCPLMQLPVTITQMCERPFPKMSKAQTAKERKEGSEERRRRGNSAGDHQHLLVISENMAEAQPGACFSWHEHKGNKNLSQRGCRTDSVCIHPPERRRDIREKPM